MTFLYRDNNAGVYVVLEEILWERYAIRPGEEASPACEIADSLIRYFPTDSDLRVSRQTILISIEPDLPQPGHVMIPLVTALRFMAANSSVYAHPGHWCALTHPLADLDSERLIQNLKTGLYVPSDESSLSDASRSDIA